MNNRVAIPLALVFSILAACGPGPRLPSDPRPTPTPTLEATGVLPFSPTPTSLAGGRPRVVYTSSLSLVVEDPSTALTVLQEAIVNAGGFVASASSWSSPGSAPYANLSARVPPESVPALRRTALELASQVQSDSSYSQDVTYESHQLQERLQTLSMAENHLWALLGQTTDPQLVRSLMTLLDLVGTDKANVQSQLADYQRRAELASFDVALNGSAVLISLE